MNFRHFILVLFACLLLTSCSKIGLTGPAGPVGPQGPPNNANVTSYLISDQSWTAGLFKFGVPGISQLVLDSGLVLGYARNHADTLDWYPLPFLLGTDILSMEYYRLDTVDMYSNYSGAHVDFRFDIIMGQ
jgi:hypothetical protein